MQQVTSNIDPAPSRWSYRMQRMLLTPLYRRLLRFGIPFALAFGVGSWYLSDAAVQEKIIMGVSELRAQVESRPEFMVKLLAVEGASDVTTDDIRETFAYSLPLSSFDMDLDAVRVSIEELPAVASAAVRLRQGGVLEVRVTERQPAALMRTPSGLIVIDMEGVPIDVAMQRSDHADLTVLAGEGAQDHVAEALAIRAAAGPLAPRMRGLVRMGERRWDVVLDRGQRIMLPEDDPVRALERVIVLNETQEMVPMLDRDVATVDMRLAERPSLRMKERAIDEWWSVRGKSLEGSEQ
ncbi:cell division protein FtsQ/DivIB [Roseovarius aestuarii]|nr:cell division protein FtsQ/DivIB [Roseovarius aestuarii]